MGEAVLIKDGRKYKKKAGNGHNRFFLGPAGGKVGEIRIAQRKECFRQGTGQKKIIIGGDAWHSSQEGGHEESPKKYQKATWDIRSFIDGEQTGEQAYERLGVML